MGSGPAPVALFYLHLFKGPICKCSHVLGPWGYGFNMWIWGTHLASGSASRSSRRSAQ